MLAEYVPDGPDRDELLGLVRIGLAFKAQHRGRRPGHLTQYVHALVARLKPRTFAALLLELEVQALRREHHGEGASPVESVRRDWEDIIFHDRTRGRCTVTFKTLQNLAALRKS